MTQIGVLSDTHLYQITEEYHKQCRKAFADCSAIIHAGDLTTITALEPFAGKEVFAVSGNMCDYETQKRLPKSRRVAIEGITIGISHGAGNRSNIEERLFDMFPDVDCIVYGHTHRPVCHRDFGGILMINPGSFQTISRYGGAGSYGILTIENDRISGKIYSLSALSL